MSAPPLPVYTDEQPEPDNGIGFFRAAMVCGCIFAAYTLACIAIGYAWGAP